MIPKEAKFEYTFSYWLFAWFILYYFKITKYNPKIWLIIGVIINIFQTIVKLYNKKYIKIINYIIVNFFIKFLPLYLLRNTKYKFIDFIVGIILLIVFLLFLLLSLGSITNIIKYFKNLKDAEKYNKPSTPLITFLNKIYKSRFY
jgi:hypothetical protein